MIETIVKNKPNDKKIKVSDLKVSDVIMFNGTLHAVLSIGTSENCVVSFQTINLDNCNLVAYHYVSIHDYIQKVTTLKKAIFVLDN